jgi:hypothetical protein
MPRPGTVTTSPSLTSTRTARCTVDIDSPVSVTICASDGNASPGPISPDVIMSRN